ncbi:hypothetical protein [Aureispira sp. CCB-E]|uniref:hypothetical protein n=2 Tax=unclassified Aureispira TaxID=2649989 RepID=UPI002869438E|nr:hypothetical protein [Aureispira sp. CCB-E]WMX15674.1 hypothetical protein QP953_04675 [Aureispira sp. CCB-E]
MKLLFLALFLMSYGIIVKQDPSCIEKNARELVTWFIKTNKDCYLVLNESDWGEIKKDIYTKISLEKGMNILKFKKEKDGNVIKKEIVVVEDTTKKKMNITLPGEVVIYDVKNEKERQESGSRKVIQMCKEYQNELNRKPTNKAILDICINEEGVVERVKFVKSEVDSLSQETIDLLMRCVKQFRYEAAPNTPIMCGKLILHLGSR